MISILRESEETESEKETVDKLNKLLHTSTYYDTNTVLRTLVQRGHDYEAAYLYGKLGNHRKAFEIYLIKHHNHREALKHCLMFRNSSSQSQTKITSELFDLYLELYRTNDPELIIGPFLEFLNHSKCKFNIEKILKDIPQDWPLIWIKNLLQAQVRNVTNQRFSTSMGKALALSLRDPKRKQKQSFVRKSICLDDER